MSKPKYEWTKEDAEAEREGKAIDYMKQLNVRWYDEPKKRKPRGASLDVATKDFKLFYPPDEKQPTPAQQELLDLIHPFGSGTRLGERLSVSGAARVLGITVSAAQDRLKSLKKRCPNTYAEWRRWPSSTQMQVFLLVSPDYGDLTADEAAALLGKSRNDVFYHIHRLKKKYPNIAIRLQGQPPEPVYKPQPEPKTFSELGGIDEDDMIGGQRIIRKF